MAIYSLCAQDVAIATALMNNTLTVREFYSTLMNEEYVMIGDDVGQICVELTRQEAESRIEWVRGVIS